MAITMTAIATTSVGSGQTQSFLEFANVPQTYTDLRILYTGRVNRSFIGDGVFIRFNSDTTAGNYTQIRMFGNGSNAVSDGGSSFGGAGLVNANTATSASIFGTNSLYINNYSASTYRKRWIMEGAVLENNATEGYQQMAGGQWTSTNAITNIRLYPEVGPLWTEFSTATLYGILRA